jgi:hypothetical protein
MRLIWRISALLLSGIYLLALPTPTVTSSGITHDRQDESKWTTLSELPTDPRRDPLFPNGQTSRAGRNASRTRLGAPNIDIPKTSLTTALHALARMEV